MPRQYEHIKAGYLKRGDTEDEAQRKAAMTYVAKGKGGTRSSRAKSLHTPDYASRRKTRTKK